MPLQIEAHTAARYATPAPGEPIGASAPRSDATASAKARARSSSDRASARGGSRPLAIGLVNNMPDSALEATERQFVGLLDAAAGARPLTLRLSSLPELPRSPETSSRIAREYWPLDELLAQQPDALIVTGTEPRAAQLTQEPYWESLRTLLDWARAHTATSIWSCLAAHAVVEILDGIRRQRLAEKRSGVYTHSILGGHPLLRGVSTPLSMPHSRWNELPADALRAAGYTLLSWSAETGADAFVREDRGLLLFFQGHPEYEATTLLREYRRDVGRYLSGQQTHYPTVPCGYFPGEALATLSAFREQALTARSPALLERFPFADLAASLDDTWRPAAVAIYRNWLSIVASAPQPAGVVETV
jgi:homoserine O-succinyltransferase/O-acetyltransferase